MKAIEFETSAAQKIYDDYIYRVAKTISILSEEDRIETLMEINSHIYEATSASINNDEVDNLLVVTERLGRPEEFLLPVVAEKKKIQAQNSFNPKHIWQALKLNISQGIFYVILSLLYLFLSAFGFLVVTKLVAPDHTGLFYLNEQFEAFGFVSNTDGLNEVMGYWFVPLVLLSAIALYFLITLLFRLKKSP